MIHDSASHHVLKIGELTRVIASHLVSICPKSSVNLACACRYLEEPVLSALWETQQSLYPLLMTLPEDTWGEWGHLEYSRIEFRIVKDPPPEAWDRVQRYASLMHKILVLEWATLGEGTFHTLRLNSPPGGWFPALQDLDWTVTKYNFHHAALFFSPHLKKVTMNASESWRDFDVPRDLLLAISSIISALPTSALQLLAMRVDCRGLPGTYFKELFSSVVLRCGPSLTGLDIPDLLSHAAINHLTQLSHFHTLSTGGPPPNFSPSSLPPVFPPLVQLTLQDHAACGWLPLFERLEHGVLTTSGVTPLSRMKESLRFLDVQDPSGSTFDISLTSPIRMFCNLTSLTVDVWCGVPGNGQCAFGLNDDDVADLAIALPQLECLILGHPCFRNTCATTVVCLLSISTYCVKLRNLEIHFNTINIVGNLKTTSEDPRYEALRQLPKCTLSSLVVYCLPLVLHESDLGTVADGMIDIFPSLERCSGPPENLGWKKLSERIAVHRGIMTASHDTKQ